MKLIWNEIPGFSTARLGDGPLPLEPVLNRIGMRYDLINHPLTHLIVACTIWDYRVEELFNFTQVGVIPISVFDITTSVNGGVLFR